MTLFICPKPGCGHLRSGQPWRDTRWLPGLCEKHLLLAKQVRRETPAQARPIIVAAPVTTVVTVTPTKVSVGFKHRGVK